MCLLCSNCQIFNRYEVKDDGKGGLTLVVHKLKLDDEGEYTCKIGRRETSCKLTVDEGLYRIAQRTEFELCRRKFDLVILQ